MADTIDTLELKIQSDSRSASDGLDRLVSSLLGLDKASKRGTSGLSRFSSDIQSFANAAKMLNKVKMPDMSVFNVQGDFNGLQNLSQGITALANSVQTLSGVRLGQISQAGTRLERLGRIDLSGFANAVKPLSGMDFSGLVSLGSSFQQFTDSMIGAEKVTSGTQKIFTALAQLAASAGNIPIIQQALPSLTLEIQKFISGMAQAPIVESGTVSLVNALSGIATSGTRAEKAAAALPSLTKAITDFVEALARAPALNNNVVNAIQSLSQFASTGSRAGAAASSLQSRITGLSSSMGGLRAGISKGVISIKNLTRSLLSAAGIAGGLYGAFQAIRKAIDISSDLTEVQNVVDVTFGDMAEKIDKLAETSIQDFGLSELTLKQISSRFQAMGVAMGFGQEKMSDMSIELTKLAADMASFYNVEQEAVAEDLASVFTGTTRPLRQYGLDLTEATLSEWAMKNGLDADIKSMTQAEKTMLRYQYVLANTTAAQGDFTRTADTWANQLRILVQNFQALGSVVGGVLINAFKPLISVLNSVMQSVIAFAETVANALGVIFGWTIRIDSGGIANDFEAAGAGAEAMEDGTGGAADNAKKMSKYIAAWQEVNNMTTPDDTDGSGGGGGGAGGAGGAAEAAEAELVQMETIFDKYKSEIDNLFELGEYVGKTLTDALNSINWESVYEGARNFGKGLADFLNGLISPELFGAVGRTIAGALNTAIYAALSFGENFDWKDFGLSIATGINEFFNTFDFSALAHTINVWANGLLDAIIEALDKINWRKIGTQIGVFLSELDFTEIAGKVMRALWKALNAAFETYMSMFKTAPFETAILSLVGVTKLLKTNTANKFFKSLKNGISVAENLGGALVGQNTALSNLQTQMPKTAKVVEALRSAFGKFQFGIINGNLFTRIKAGFESITGSIQTAIKNLSPLAKGIGGIISVVGEFMLVKDGFYDLASGSGSLIKALGEIGAAAGIAGGFLYTAFGPAGVAMAAITGIIGAILGIKEAVEEIEAERTGEEIKEAFSNPGGTPIEDIVGNFTEAVTTVGDSFSTISEKAGGMDTVKTKVQDTWMEIEKIELAMDSGVLSVEEGSAKLTELFGTLASTAQEKFGILEDTLLAAFGENGALAQSYEKTGIKTEELMKDVLQVNDSTLKRIEEITKELSTLDPSNPKYMELKQELAELMGTTDDLSRAISDYDLKISSVDIDYSGLLNGAGELDESKLTSILDSITSAIGDANTDITNGVSSIKDALEQELQAAIDIGDNVSAEKFREALQALPNSMNELQSDITTQGTNLTDALQMEFVDKINDIVSNAQADWDNLNWTEKLIYGFDETTYIQEKVSSYKTNYIDPLSQEIEESFEQLGIDGAGWSSAAAEDIVAKMFDVTVIPDTGQVITTLNANWQNIVTEATKGIPESARTAGEEITKEYGAGIEGKIDDLKDPTRTAFEGYAAYSEEGFRKKIEDLQKDSTPKTMESWAKTGIMNPFAKILGINSPSKVFSDYGKNVVEGLNQGITSNQSSSQNPIQSWVSSIKTSFTTALGINSPSTVFNGYGQNIVQGLNNGISSNESSTQGVIGSWVSKIKNWFTSKLDIGSPSKVFEDFGVYTIDGFNKGIENNMGSSFNLIRKWSDGITNGFSVDIPQLDYTVPEVDFTPKVKASDFSDFQSAMQMEMDARMAEYEFEMQQMRESNERVVEVLERIESKGIVLDDNTFEKKYKSSAKAYRKRTGGQLGVSY